MRVVMSQWCTQSSFTGGADPWGSPSRGPTAPGTPSSSLTSSKGDWPKSKQLYSQCSGILFGFKKKIIIYVINIMILYCMILVKYRYLDICGMQVVLKGVCFISKKKHLSTLVASLKTVLTLYMYVKF